MSEYQIAILFRKLHIEVEKWQIAINTDCYFIGDKLFRLQAKNTIVGENK